MPSLPPLALASLALAAVGLAACAAPDEAASRLRPALPAPSPPGWFAFCAARGGTPDGDCDPVPRAAAMRDSRPVAAPAAWLAFCHRHREDDACAR